MLVELEIRLAESEREHRDEIIVSLKKGIVDKQRRLVTDGNGLYGSVGFLTEVIATQDDLRGVVDTIDKLPCGQLLAQMAEWGYQDRFWLEFKVAGLILGYNGR